MIVTVQIAELELRESLRALARRPQPGARPGLRYAETVFTAPLGGRLLPAANLRTVGLIAAWDGEDDFDAFLAADPRARPFAAGWQVRLEPLRVSGGEPVAVLTLGRLMPWRLRPFLRTALPAEDDAVAEPGLLASTGFGRFPRLVSTFSLWSSAEEMRDYAYRAGGSHRAAVAADAAHPFHHHSAFIRFRPLASAGRWGGRDPLAAALRRAAS